MSKKLKILYNEGHPSEVRHPFSHYPSDSTEYYGSPAHLLAFLLISHQLVPTLLMYIGATVGPVATPLA
jgi:hypothetical protein